MKVYKQVDNKIEICILPRMEKEIYKLFEKEISHGRRQVLPDGRLYFAFEVTPEKARLLHWVAQWIEKEYAGECN